MTSVTAFAPATVSNVACGFDVLGFALHEPGDEVTARITAGGVQIDDISGERRHMRARRQLISHSAQPLCIPRGENEVPSAGREPAREREPEPA